MPREVFEVSFSRSAARELHARAHGDVEREVPWDELDPAAFDPALLARARVSWTEAAFNEHCTGLAMAQLVQALTQARAPLDLVSLAARFVADEVVHVELCSRVLARLGGGAPIVYDPDDLPLALAPGLTPLQRASELIVRVCCVGEALSLPLLAGAMRAAAHPVTRAVLEWIVRDEALHGRLGWWYLDWVARELDDAERARLGRVAARELRRFDPIWRPLRPDGPERTAEGFPAQQARALGWMDAGEYRALFQRTAAEEVRAPLLARGIVVPDGAR